MRKEDISREELEQIAAKGITDADLDVVFALAKIYGDAVNAEYKEAAQKQLRLAIGEGVKNTVKFKEYLYELDTAFRELADCPYYPAVIVLDEMQPIAHKGGRSK